jgi:hypothetical protein
VSRPWIGPLLAGVGAALLVLIFAWPVLLDPGGRIIGATQADFYGLAFGMDHLARHLVEGQWPPLHTTRLEYPAGAVLLVTDLPEMLLLAPITALLGPTVAFNLLQLLHHALAAAAAWWCARTLGFGLSGRALVALAFAFAPALVGTTFNQNPDASAWYWVPLVAGLAASAAGWRRAALAGLAVGLAAWCTPYAAVMAAAALVMLLRGRDWRRWGAALGSAGLVGGGAAWLYAWSVRIPGSAVFKPGGNEALHGAARLGGLVSPRPQLHTNLGWDLSNFVHDSYLGLSLILLGLVGALWGRRWRWLLLALVGLLLALGPVLVHAEGFELRNPLWALGNRLGLVPLWQYHRYTALVVLALSLGAGGLAHRLGRWGWALVLVVALDLLLLTGAWQRLGAAPVFEDGACELLRGLPEGPVYDLPPGSHELWLYAATCHGREVNSGINRPDGRYLASSLQRAGEGDPAKRLAVLEQLGFRYLVLHPDAPMGVARDPMVALLEACEAARNEAGVRVMDLQACASALPELAPLPAPRDPGASRRSSPRDRPRRR